MFTKVLNGEDPANKYRAIFVRRLMSHARQDICVGPDSFVWQLLTTSPFHAHRDIDITLGGTTGQSRYKPQDTACREVCGSYLVLQLISEP